MAKAGVIFSIFCSLFLWASMSFSQQVAAPVYKEGDWWKIKVEVRYATGISKSGYCEEAYSEYMVKIDQDQKKVYGIKDAKQEQLDCPDILEQLLGIETDAEPNSQKHLVYPLAVGKTWAAQVAEERERKARTKRANVRWLNLEYKVLAWENLKTPKGELGAFKIEVSGWPWGKPTYYYSPDAKAIVRLRQGKQGVTRIVTLLDYSVSK